MREFRDQLDDAVYGVRAWAQGIAWLTVIGGIGFVLAGWAREDTVMFSSGITAVVVAFFPRARPKFVYEMARSFAMTSGWSKVPVDEKPLRDPDGFLMDEISPAVSDDMGGPNPTSESDRTSRRAPMPPRPPAPPRRPDPPPVRVIHEHRFYDDTNK